MNSKLVSFFLLILFIVLPSDSVNSLEVSDASGAINTFTLQYLEDEEGLQQLDDVINYTGWKVLEKNIVNFGFTHSVYWFRFQIDNTAKNNLKHLFFIQNHMLNSLEFFSKDSHEGFSKRIAGTFLPFNKREVKDHRSFIFNINILPGKNIYIVRIKSQSSVNFQYKLVPEDMYQPDVLTGMEIFSLIVLLLIIIHIAYWKKSRQVSVVVYLVYLVAFFLLQASASGVAFQYLWPESVWLASHGLPITFSLFIVSAAFFYQAYAREDIRSKVRDVFISIFVVIPGVFAAGSSVLFNFSTAMRMTTILLLAALIILFIASFVLLLKGSKSGVFFFLGLLVFLVSLVPYTLKTFGIIPDVFFTRWSVQTGLLGMFILHSPILKKFLNDSGTSHEVD